MGLKYENKEFLFEEPPQDDFFHLVNGKKVVIVGSADHLIGSQCGQLIDSYDVVIRLNDVILSMPFKDNLAIDIGTKTDVLYFNGGKIYSVDWKEKEGQLRNYVGASCIVRRRDNSTAQKVFRFFGHDPKKNPPSTGFCAIVDLLKYPVEQIYITGFNFFHSGQHMFSGKRVKPLYGGHDFYIELRIMRFISLHEVVYVDDVLFDMLQIKI